MPVVNDDRELSSVEDLIDRLPDGFVALDETGVIRHANPAFLDLVQVGSKTSAIGESLGRWLWQPGADVNALLANIQRHKTIRLFTTTIRGELGTETEIEISAGTTEGSERNLIGVLLRNVARRLPSGGEADLLRTALGSMSEQIGKSSLRKHRGNPRGLSWRRIRTLPQRSEKPIFRTANGKRFISRDLFSRTVRCWSSANQITASSRPVQTPRHFST